MLVIRQHYLLKDPKLRENIQNKPKGKEEKWESEEVGGRKKSTVGIYTRGGWEDHPDRSRSSLRRTNQSPANFQVDLDKW